MGSVRITFCSSAVLAAALTPAACPVVSAADGGISVTPSPPAPGSDIQLRVQGCSGRTGTASSEAFVADAVLTGKGGALAGETRVRSSLRPGTYRVKVTCDGAEDKIKTKLTVAAKEGGHKPSAPETPRAPAAVTPRAPAPETPRAPAAVPSRGLASPVAPVSSPVAPVRAGGGGAAHAVAAQSGKLNARDEGPGTRHAVVGLVLAGAAALVVALRGTRRGRGTQ